MIGGVITDSGGEGVLVKGVWQGVLRRLIGWQVASGTVLGRRGLQDEER